MSSHSNEVTQEDVQHFDSLQYMTQKITSTGKLCQAKSKAFRPILHQQMASSIYKNGVYQAAAMRPNGMKIKRRSIGNQADGTLAPIGGKLSEKGSPKAANNLLGS